MQAPDFNNLQTRIIDVMHLLSPYSIIRCKDVLNIINFPDPIIGDKINADQKTTSVANVYRSAPERYWRLPIF